MRIYVTSNPPPAPSGLGRGAATPVTDLKQRTINRYPYTEEGKELVWSTPTKYYTADPHVGYHGYYSTVNEPLNTIKRFVGGQEKPVVAVIQGGPYPREMVNFPEVYGDNPQLNDESSKVMGHEIAHRYYFQRPDAFKWSFMEEPRAVAVKSDAWRNYAGEEFAQQADREDRWLGTAGRRSETESYAEVAENPEYYEALPAEVRQRHFGGLYDEDEIQRRRAERYAVVNPENVEKKTLNDWDPGVAERLRTGRGEY